jgi:hypothetical protein
MKTLKSGLFILLALFLFWGCKDKDEPDHLLVGQWRWESMMGGFEGQAYQPKSGDKMVLLFTNDGRFEIKQNDTLQVSGNYRLEQVESLYSKDKVTGIITENVSYYNKDFPRYNHRFWLVNATITELTTGNLRTVNDNLFDGYSYRYSRIK